MGVYKKQYIGGIPWKMGLAQFVDLRGGVLGIKYRCCVFDGGRLIPQCALWAALNV